MGDCPVNVSVRVKPTEIAEIYNLDYNENVLFAGDKLFTFDKIFNEESTQQDVFETAAKPFISKVLSGYNCTILAYGQTGSGKTYTMGTDGLDSGIVSELLWDIFSNHINDNLKLSISFFEVYNEKIYDLLDKCKLLIMKGFKVPGLNCVPVSSQAEAMNMLRIGGATRHVRSTNQNDRSSRSHAVFTIYFNKEDGTVSKLHVVDLAGSESANRTGNSGVAFAEGVHINRSLLSLGQVIRALSRRSKMIPYRDSTLTAILQDSLSSKNYVCLVACVSLKQQDITETMSTLRFAEKMKTILTQPEKENILARFKEKFSNLFEKPRLYPTPMKRALTELNSVQSILQPLNVTNASNASSRLMSMSKADSLSDFSVITSSSQIITETPQVTGAISNLMQRFEKLEATIMKHLAPRYASSPNKVPTTSSPANSELSPVQAMNAQRLAFSPANTLFKVPALPKSRQKQSKREKSNSPVPLRRSVRLSMQREQGNTTIYNSSFTFYDQLNSTVKKKMPTRRSIRLSESFGKTPPKISQEQLSKKTLSILNYASEKRLCTLPTIGAKKAKQIVTYRQLHGKFQSLADLESIWAKSTYTLFLRRNLLTPSS